MSGLVTRLGRLTLDNPVVCASGCFGHGFEMSAYTDLSRIGGISLKTVTPTARPGNKPPRIREVTAGLLSSIGLQNPGIEHFIEHIMPRVLACCNAKQIIVSIAGDAVEEYVMMAKTIGGRYKHEIAAIELNTACPNTRHGAGFFCQRPDELDVIVTRVLHAVDIPVVAKINTNFENYCDAAVAIARAGADAINLANTPIGMSIDLKTRKPALGNVKGPVSGPAIRPIGVSKTWDIYKAAEIPIISSGGIYTSDDALEYIMAGATAVGIGSAHFINPGASLDILEGLEAYMARHGCDCHSLTGIAHRN